MDPTRIVAILTNSGLIDVRVDGDFIYFQDPSCIFPAFDTILHYAWIVCLVLTAIILFGWGVLYIKNGVNINSLFKNAKSLLLIFGVLSVVIPIINFIYDGNLFGQQCESKRVSLSSVQELLTQRDKHFSNSNINNFFDDFTVIDSGVILPPGYSNDNWDDFTSGGDSSGIKLIGFTSNSTTYQKPNGEIFQRISDKSPSWRNNNPGNITAPKNAEKYPNDLGAIGAAGRWLVFPDEQAGLMGIVKLLKKPGYINLTISEAIHKWAPFGDGNNTPDNYTKKLCQMTGLSANARIKDLSDSDLMRMARAKQKIEGWIPGTEKVIK